MGHRIGAHNFGHRDLRFLRALPDIRYEVDNALEGTSEILGAPCNDFAIAYGMPHNLSDEAIVYLQGLRARGMPHLLLPPRPQRARQDALVPAAPRVQAGSIP